MRGVLGVALLVGLGPILSGCLGGNPGGDGGTSSPAAEDSCTALPAPRLPREDQSGVRAANAMDYVIGLVCDHSGAAARERPRVPNTPDHEAGGKFLYHQLRKAGLQARFQNFTGNDYERIMEDDRSAGSQFYYDYYSRCKGTDEMTRMRGLRFANVEGRTGTQGGPILLFMAHWDSKRFASVDPDPAGRSRPVLGANDGASGVGVLLELGRVLARQTVPFEIRILFTDGEDGFEDCHPLAGSTYYSEQLQNDAAARGRLRGIVLLDMVGHPTAAFYKGCGSDAQLTDKIWSIAQRLDVRQFKNQTGCQGIDDHTPFENRGMKSLDVVDQQTSSFAPHWHTTEDTPDKLNADLLGAVGRVLHTLVQEMTV